MSVASLIKRILGPVIAGLLLASLGLVAHALDAEMLQARSDEPRAFGYTVGDVVSRRITLTVPAGLRLDRDSLPRPGARGKALELQRVVLQSAFSGAPEALELQYQVFLAPREVRVLEMPPIVLRFEGSPRPQTLRIDAWPVTVGPLVPLEAPTRDGLGDMRPDLDPPPLDTTWPRARLMLSATAALLLLGYLAHVYLVLPWSAQRRRPFGRAWLLLRSLPAQPDSARRRDAFERLHAALNETAGQVLFAPGLDAFIARWPRYAPLQGELARFFAHSRDEFFAPGGAAVDARWLVDVARRLRDLERGAA